VSEPVVEPASKPVIEPSLADRQRFLGLAIAEAVRGAQAGQGGPFGAVIVKDGIVLACAANAVVANNDPTAHAEVQAIRAACAALGTFQLDGCDIYASCEPCPMCLGAILWAGLAPSTTRPRARTPPPPASTMRFFTRRWSMVRAALRWCASACSAKAPRRRSWRTPGFRGKSGTRIFHHREHRGYRERMKKVFRSPDPNSFHLVRPLCPLCSLWLTIRIRPAC
jgi:hypothetical protein